MSDCEVPNSMKRIDDPEPDEPLLCSAEETAWGKFLQDHFPKGGKLEWTHFDLMSAFKAGIEYADDLAKQGG